MICTPAFKISPYYREALAPSLGPELEVSSPKNRASQEVPQTSTHRVARSMMLRGCSDIF